MNIFEGLIQVDDNGHMVSNQWIEWEHFLIPNKPALFRQIMRNLMAKLGHCLICTVLDGCYFVKDANKMPNRPLHPHCDCREKNIQYKIIEAKANAECAIEKFTKYVFKDTKKSKGKNKIFYDLGFTIDDSEFLKNEFCKQALQQYRLGNYKLKDLNSHGQRIAIPTELKGSKFYSGWMVYPEGTIKNTTPFSGWIK